jgi:hypothetical protein
MSDPTLAFLALGGGFMLEAVGYDQAARAEQIKQQEIARQARDNALAIKAQAERDSTIRSQRYSEFLRDSSAIRGYNRRGADRSFKAIQEKARKQTAEELRQVSIQSLFARGRQEQRARFAIMEGQLARDLALIQTVSALADTGYKASQVK